MTKFCNQCGRSLLDEEVCNCEDTYVYYKANNEHDFVAGINEEGDEHIVQPDKMNAADDVEDEDQDQDNHPSPILTSKDPVVNAPEGAPVASMANKIPDIKELESRLKSRIESEKEKARSKKVEKGFVDQIEKFWRFLYMCFKAPGTTLSQFVAGDSLKMSCFFIMLQAVMISLIVAFTLSRMSSLIEQMAEDFFFLTGYSQNFPTIRSFFVTIIMVLVNHGVFIGTLTLLQSRTMKGTFKQMMTVSAAGAIAYMPFLFLGIVTMWIHPFIGIAFILCGNLLAVFFIWGAVKELWEKDFNKALYVMFLAYLITMVIMVVIFCFTYQLYLPERTITKWLN